MRFSGLMGAPVRVLETFRSLVVTNNCMGNVWSQLGGVREFNFLVAVLVRLLDFGLLVEIAIAALSLLQ